MTNISYAPPPSHAPIFCWETSNCFLAQTCFFLAKTCFFVQKTLRIKGIHGPYVGQIRKVVLDVLPTHRDIFKPREPRRPRWYTKPRSKAWGKIEFLKPLQKALKYAAFILLEFENKKKNRKQKLDICFLVYHYLHTKICLKAEQIHLICQQGKRERG